ncbi:long-chain-fatty-acid--CoA ligase [Spelaeicoccus albus]|uniref:Long-chain acyl-CoA synthetase n=1 Tax=Spelaeicoccus albus TaxID=1280376 RepID=A0A7Z0D300_9MICO|nr:long-chain fatty acid--CoA ligase [Spelaeicoccus albus]NYI67932.1 long-chain acyl-CoA synthetase [Spelaeicoccus albus]
MPSVEANLANNLARTAATYPTNTAVKLDDAEIDFRTLNGLGMKVAGLLSERSVADGDRIALVMPNVPHTVALYYGILRLGAIVVPMNPLLKAREVAFHLEDSGAELVFVWEAFADEVKKAAEPLGVDVVVVGPDFITSVSSAPTIETITSKDDDDVAVVLYTSGTTGRPKGASLTHANMRKNAEVSVNLMGTSSDDVIFGGLPLFHVFGQTCCMNAGILMGAMLTLLPRFDPEKALHIVERDKVTVFAGVPTMYVAMLRCPERKNVDVSSWRLSASGGSALPVEVLSAWDEEFPNATIIEGYGLSETSPVVCFNQLDVGRKPGSIGTPVTGIDMKIVDPVGEELPAGEVGEIVIRGHAVMKEYWGNPKATAEAIPDGWFRTGDLARVDEDGFFFIVDRKKDMIVRGGYNVYPREVEEVLYSHPAVNEAAVVGRPDSLHGEEIVAVVSLREDAEGAGDEDGRQKLAAELIEFAKERLAAYKYPREVEFIGELPKGPTGKILKRSITVEPEK